MAQLFRIPDSTAEAMGFPLPSPGRMVKDSTGRVWTYHDDGSGLAGLSGWVAPVVGAGGSIGGSIIGGMIGGSWGGPIGAGIGLITGIISGIFAAHSAKVAREDEISGAWAASGPQAIEAVLSANRSGQITASEAAQALDQIEAQFRSMTQVISKYNGKFGAFPDPNAGRPPNNCNWACGTSWDLHKQLAGLKAGLVNSGGGAGGGFNLSGLGIDGDPVVLGGMLVIGFMLLKGK